MSIGRLMTMEERIVLDAVVAVDVPENAGAEAGGGGEDIGATGVKEAAPSTTTPIDTGTTAESKVGTTVDNLQTEKNNAENSNVVDQANNQAEEALRAILVNKDLQDFDSLVDSIAEDVLVYSYDNNVDDLQEIIDGLKEQAEGQLYDSIAIATEGNGEGSFALTESEIVSYDTVDTEAEQDQQEFFEALAGLVDDGGEIDILSCNTAEGEHGAELIEAIAGITGLDVEERIGLSPDYMNVDATSKEIAIIDSNVSDVDELARLLLLDAEKEGRSLVIHTLSSGEGTEDVASILSQYERLSAIHLFAHGDDGYFVLGNDIVSENSIDNLSGNIAKWGDALIADGDILIYSCDLAANKSGEKLIEKISEITEADIAGSDDSINGVGTQSHQLEYSVGNVLAEELNFSSYHHTLQSFTVTTGSMNIDRVLIMTQEEYDEKIFTPTSYVIVGKLTVDELYRCYVTEGDGELSLGEAVLLLKV